MCDPVQIYVSCVWQRSEYGDRNTGERLVFWCKEINSTHQYRITSGSEKNSNTPETSVSRAARRSRRSVVISTFPSSKDEIFIVDGMVLRG